MSDFIDMGHGRVPNDKPEGWGSIQLGTLFSAEDLKHLITVFDSVDGDAMQAMDILKPWFTEPERAAHLEANGMLASYASYAIPFFIGKHYQQIKLEQGRGNPLWN